MLNYWRTSFNVHYKHIPVGWHQRDREMFSTICHWDILVKIAVKVLFFNSHQHLQHTPISIVSFQPFQQQYLNTLLKLPVVQYWRSHSSHRFLLLLRCSAAMDQCFQTDTEHATTLSQTTLSSLCPVSMRAHRQVQQRLLSVWCRDYWTWRICAVNATPAPIWLHKDRFRRWRRTHKQR